MIDFPVCFHKVKPERRKHTCQESGFVLSASISQQTETHTHTHTHRLITHISTLAAWHTNKRTPVKTETCLLISDNTHTQANSCSSLRGHISSLVYTHTHTHTHTQYIVCILVISTFPKWVSLCCTKITQHCLSHRHTHTHNLLMQGWRQTGQDGGIKKRQGRRNWTS